MSRGKFSPTRLFVIVALLLLGVVIVSNKESAKSIVRLFLESNWPSVAIWLLAIIGVLAERFFASPAIISADGFIYHSFGKYADSIFTIATYGLSGSTSLALLKGLYLQMFFGGMYFTGFGDFDFASILVISSFLLFYSVNGTVRQLIKVVFQAEATEMTATQSANQPDARH